MTKRQLIDAIIGLNRSAKPEFLAQFQTDQLEAYLRHLQLAQTPRLSPSQGQYAKYFKNVPVVRTAEAAEPEPAAAPEQPDSPNGPPIQPTLFNDDLDDEEPTVAAGATDAGGRETPLL